MTACTLPKKGNLLAEVRETDGRELFATASPLFAISYSEKRDRRRANERAFQEKNYGEDIPASFTQFIRRHPRLLWSNSSSNTLAKKHMPDWHILHFDYGSRNHLFQKRPFPLKRGKKWTRSTVTTLRSRTRLWPIGMLINTRIGDKKQQEGLEMGGLWLVGRRYSMMAIVSSMHHPTAPHTWRKAKALFSILCQEAPRCRHSASSCMFGVL